MRMSLGRTLVRFLFLAANTRRMQPMDESAPTEIERAMMPGISIRS